MMINLVFEITEKRGAKPLTIGAFVDVPENWHSLTKDQKREFLIKPRFSYEIHGQTIFQSSRFQEVFDDPVYDFEFSEKE